MSNFGQVDDAAGRPHAGASGTTMCGYVEPVSVPIINRIWKLTPVNPYLQASQFNVWWPKVFLRLFHRCREAV